MNEYTHVEDHVFGDKIGGRGADYARYVEDTVRPFIELRYGTPRVVGVMGSSLGGLMAFYQVICIRRATTLRRRFRRLAGAVRPAYSDDDRYLPFDVKS